MNVIVKHMIIFIQDRKIFITLFFPIYAKSNCAKEHYNIVIFMIFHLYSFHLIVIPKNSNVRMPKDNAAK